MHMFLERARTLSYQVFGRYIRFYAPSFMRYEHSFYRAPINAFASISITGNSCSLGCKHCGGRVLRTMISATQPAKLLSVCTSLSEQGYRGVLISGGCLPDGTVPLADFIPTIFSIKKKLGLRIAVHTGIIDSHTANELARAGVDIALIDVIGADETIKEIYNLNITTKDYEASLRALEISKIPFVPHVITGLHFGRLLGEIQALRMISKHSPTGIVIIAFIPIHGTAMGNFQPPTPEDIARVLVEARFQLPKTPISLGCMRPPGTHRTRTDILAIDSGVNAIAFPDEVAVEYAKKRGLEIEFIPACCAQAYEDFRSRAFNTRVS